MIDQAERLRQLARGQQAVAAAAQRPPEHAVLRKRGRVLAVTSGKGGVGKSVITVNLALALARLRRKVIIFDADFGLANADVLLNVRPAFTLQHFIDGTAGVSDCLVACAPGVSLLPGGSGVPRLADMDYLQRQTVLQGLQELEEQADYLIIDTGAGISRNVVSMVLAADEALVVTTPDPTAVTDAYAMIKIISLRQKDLPVRLLVNMAVNAQEAEAVSRRIRQVSEQFLGFAVGSWATVAMDAAVAVSVRRKQPLLLSGGQSEAARCLNALARDLAYCGRTDRSGQHAPAVTGFFSRLSGIFASAAPGDRTL